MPTEDEPNNYAPNSLTSFTSTPEDDDADDADVVDASTLPDSTRLFVITALRRRWFPDGESVLVRFLNPKIIAVNTHNWVKTNGENKLTLHCNGAGCVLCMARHKATPSYLILALFVEENEIAVLHVDQSGGPDSLRGQIIPQMKHPNLTDLIFEVGRQGKRHTVSIVADLSQNPVDGDYGSATIRDALARGVLKAKAIRAAVETRDNQTLLEDLDWLAPKIRLYHPGINLKDL